MTEQQCRRGFLLDVTARCRWSQPPELTLYCVDAAAAPFSVVVTGFRPYCYLAQPVALEALEEQLARASGYVERYDTREQRSYWAEPRRGWRRRQPLVHAVEPVQRRSLYTAGDEWALRTYWRVELNDSRLLYTMRDLYGPPAADGGLSAQLFESNVDLPLRFMVDCDLTGCCWLELAADGDSVDYRQLRRLHDCDALPPLAALSYDIECAGRPGYFPDAAHDPIIQIASSVYGFDAAGAERRATVLCLRETARWDDADGDGEVELVCFDSEAELLEAWAELVRETDPDLLLSYNGQGFDMPYILHRAELLGVYDSVAVLSRAADGDPVRARQSVYSSKAHGTHDRTLIAMPGRVQFDLLMYMKREFPLRSYTLNSVSQRFLSDSKEDMHYSRITPLWQGSPEDRALIASYCLKDARLPWRLLRRINALQNYVEMCRITGVTLDTLLFRGQGIKTWSLLLRETRADSMLVPLYVPPPDDGAGGEAAYKGATVIDAECGYYVDVPVPTLDFSSLYPSIMIAENLCYSTLVRGAAAAAAAEADGRAVRTPHGDVFLVSSERVGVLPRVLKRILAQRKLAKRELAAEQDPFRRGLLDGRQLALKISANSVYGFTGATIGRLPCFAISAGVTAYGRDMIFRTREHVEREYAEYGAHVIYGDTDSVMVRFAECRTVAEALRVGALAAESATRMFKSPHCLELEKAYFPYLLMSKKRYAGLLWTRPEAPDYMDAKGVESVRRDNCLLLSETVRAVLEALMERQPDEAVARACTAIGDLLQQRVGLEKLIISKAYTRHEADYAAPQVHVEMSKRMNARQPGSGPGVGSRVPYVIVAGHKAQRWHELSEDPLYVAQQRLPISVDYYLNHQLRAPLLRLFKQVLGADTAKRVLFGAGAPHMRQRKAAPAAAPGVNKLTLYFAPAPRCSQSDCMRPAARYGLCVGCAAEPERFERAMLAAMAERERVQAAADAALAVCMRCQRQSRAMVDLCEAKDCGELYVRLRTQRALAALNE